MPNWKRRRKGGVRPSGPDTINRCLARAGSFHSRGHARVGRVEPPGETRHCRWPHPTPLTPSRPDAAVPTDVGSGERARRQPTSKRPQDLDHPVYSPSALTEHSRTAAHKSLPLTLTPPPLGDASQRAKAGMTGAPAPVPVQDVRYPLISTVNQSVWWLEVGGATTNVCASFDQGYARPVENAHRQHGS